MSFCRSCGARMQDMDRFCGKCGAAVTSTHTSHTPPPYGAHLFTDTADETANFDPVDIETNKVIAGLSYFIFFLPFLLCPQSRYARFHANQGLLLLIFSAAANVLRRILSFAFGYNTFDNLWQGIWAVPNIIFSSLLGLLVLALGIVGLVNAFTGKARNLPIIGRFRLI